MKRTTLQNRSLHLYIRRLAEAMDEAGYDMRTVIQVPIHPTPENVKELMIKPIMNALYPEITSTTELSTAQVSEVYETVNRATAERLGIGVHFPSEEEMRREAQEQFYGE